jgi:serine/threonine-protein kinase
MDQMCPSCSHNNPGKDFGKLCAECGALLRGLLGAGERIRDYEAQKVLGCGGFSAVYKARDLLHNRDVALKELFALNVNDSQRFEHEAAILSRLSHPQLPAFYDHFEENGKRYLVMEFIHGQSLVDIVEARRKQGQTMRESIVMGWALQLCDVIDYLHEKGIIHRDIKPDNVRLTPAGEIYLVDLGIAKRIVPGAANQTVVHGQTSGYAPMEQYSGKNSQFKGKTDERSDVYSLGATIYTVVTNRVPEDARSLAAQVEVLVPIQQVNPVIGDQFALTVERAMKVLPQDRFASVAEMKRSFLGSAPPPPPPPPPGHERTTTDPPPPPPPKGSPFLFADGREAHDLAEFVLLCDELWDEAKDYLYDGHVEKWDCLTISGKFALVRRAKLVREGESNRDVGLDIWLQLAAQVAKVQRRAPEVTLTMHPASPLDFGRVTDWDRPGRRVQLKLQLKGSRTRRSAISCSPFLQLSQTQVDWPADGQVTIDVALRPGAGLEVGEHLLPEAVWVETDRQKQAIAVHVVVMPAVEIALEPPRLQLTAVQGQESPVGVLTLRNTGSAGWQGQIETAAWLQVKPAEVACQPGEAQQVEVRVAPETLNDPGDFQSDTAIIVRVGEETRSVPVKLLVRPSFTLAPKVLDFGEVTAAAQQELRLELHYTGRGELEAEISADVPWIEVVDFVESLAGDGVTEVVVRPKVDALAAPGIYQAERGLTVSAQGIEQSVAAKLVAQGPSLALSTQAIDFGLVATASAAKPCLIELHNPSLFAWRGEAKAAQPWLRIDPAQVECDGGRKLQLAASLTEHVDKLSPGKLALADAMAVEGMEQRYVVAARLEKAAPAPPPSGLNLEVTPARIDFGRAPHGSKLSQQRMVVRNLGAQTVRLMIDAHVGWLRVTPNSVDCPAGTSVAFEVGPTQIAGGLKDGPLHRDCVVSIAVMGRSEVIELSADLVIDRTVSVSPSPPPSPPRDIVEISPEQLEFHLVGQALGQPQDLRVVNHGMTGWKASVDCVLPWLKCEPDTIDCPANGSVRISVALTKHAHRMAMNQYDKPEAITITGKDDGRKVQIRVKLDKR